MKKRQVYVIKDQGKGVVSGVTANSLFAVSEDSTIIVGSGSVETDPVFTASPAFGITESDKTLWNDKDYNNLSNLPDLSLKADLVGSKVPASQLPSYVDDVVEFANLASFPNPGETGKIYVALDTNKIYRWSGSTYVDMTPGEADTFQSVTTRNPVTTNNITVAGVTATALQGDASYTKQIIAKPDGTFGWEDKASLTTLGGVLPSIRMLDYTENATNYMLRVSYTYGQASPSGTPIFEVRIHSANLTAQNITTTQDSINQNTSSTHNGVVIIGFVVTILIPKANNTSPIWNNNIAGIMVRLLSVDNGDGGVSSTKIVRRIASDMSTIGFLRPKQDLLVSGTNIKTINGTSLLGSGDVSVIGGFGSSGQISFFNSNTSVAGDSSLLWDNTNKQLSIGSAVINQSNARFQDNYGIILGNQAVSGSSIFHTNKADGVYGYGVWMGHNLQFNGTNFIQPRGDLISRAFTVNHHKGFSFNIGNQTGVSGGTVTMTQVASISNTGIITIAGVVADNLPNGNSDVTFTRNVIQKADGTLGWEDKLNNISTILVTNSGASLGALNANTTVDVNLNTNSTWSVSALASKTGAAVADLISSTGSILDTSDKNLNIFRVVIEVSYSGGGADGTIDASIVNPSGVVIDHDIKVINIDGVAATNQRLSFRFFAVKTSDNNAGYTLRLRCGAKSLTAYRIVSILRNNNN